MNSIRNGKQFCNRGSQAGVSKLPPRQSKRLMTNDDPPSVPLPPQTPTKKRANVLLPVRKPNEVKVSGLPGTSTKAKNKTEGRRKSVSRKCGECARDYNSEDDFTFRKLQGKRKSTWIRCDQAECPYFAHASCAGLLLVPKKPVGEHSFLCKSHRK